MVLQGAVVTQSSPYGIVANKARPCGWAASSPRSTCESSLQNSDLHVRFGTAPSSHRGTSMYSAVTGADPTRPTLPCANMGFAFIFTMAAYDLIRLPRLFAEAAA